MYSHGWLYLSFTAARAHGPYSSISQLFEVQAFSLFLFHICTYPDCSWAYITFLLWEWRASLSIFKFLIRLHFLWLAFHGWPLLFCFAFPACLPLLHLASYSLYFTPFFALPPYLPSILVITYKTHSGQNYIHTSFITLRINFIVLHKDLAVMLKMTMRKSLLL